MTQRRFRDANGVVWDVYDVIMPPAFPRAGAPPMAPISTQFQRSEAWLCFESATEKRRLSPIPEKWDTAPEHRLQELLAQATTVPKRA